MKKLLVIIGALLLLAAIMSSCGSAPPCPVYADNGQEVESQA